ncbi:MAG: TIR domain-containing protein, partial [Clostridia bacterium]|nr:TIR domain-containing protein [Clostridia bacterium]
MTIIKCKMCGGDIAVSEDKTFGTCEYCGSTMTLPKVSDDQRAALFNRGNHFRRQGEFDKALSVYENIVRENDADAEAHWCCALCRFGIEYVEDPNTYEYIPTCHRASFDSFLEDVDYLAALENSDGITKRQYQKDAAKIAEVQKGILATSQTEEPFDVFICYKETDDATKERTKDSIDAQEIYYQLTNEGYRVFFSRITLEDKAGAEYEPYIFAALNSAKVMVVLGSKPEYFNAVWVKNEWSRFLAMMRKDRSKLLLPCYKDMDPYDLPEQLGVLQSYDMAKIGFMQDLIRGVKKVLTKYDKKQSEVVQKTVVQQSGGNIDSLLKRVSLFL